MPQIKCPALSCHHGIVTNVYDHEGACKVCNGTGYVEGEEPRAEFQPAFDMPATREQALECLKKWGDPLCKTFDAARAKRMWELLKEPAPEAVRKLPRLTEDEVERIRLEKYAYAAPADHFHEMVRTIMDAMEAKVETDQTKDEAVRKLVEAAESSVEFISGLAVKVSGCNGRFALADDDIRPASLVIQKIRAALAEVRAMGVQP